ncbi:hypothetical protein LCGC14_0481060 [marine sediment metagenome]|uniref:Uncharacterized protein n=1 Tax=marine sediment metagenome TaxID=412755 RepID=A0A0F9SSJ5_9ZZZZ
MVADGEFTEPQAQVEFDPKRQHLWDLLVTVAQLDREGAYAALSKKTGRDIGAMADLTDDEVAQFTAKIEQTGAGKPQV